MVTEIYLTIPHMMMFCRGSFIWFFPIQHIFYKCGHTCNTLLVKGCGLFNSNAFLGSLSVLSWYTRFHFLDNSVGSIFFSALHLYFCLVLCHCTCKYIKDQTCAIYLCNDIYIKLLTSNFGTFQWPHFMIYIILHILCLLIQDGKSVGLQLSAFVVSRSGLQALRVSNC